MISYEKEKKMVWILSVLIIIGIFWYYNFRWVEFIPFEPNVKENPKYGAWIERKEWITPKRIECFKKKLKTLNNDYIEKDNILYVRAYYQRDKNLIINTIQSWGINPNDDKPCSVKNLTGIPGFFAKYIGNNNFAYFLDNLMMWRWGWKREIEQDPK